MFFGHSGNQRVEKKERLYGYEYKEIWYGR
ncbi:hypothetical protein HMPREF0988_01269 [Lachnospiraceae bacterium 1_4_56FAA]|nr:hypothetical protein HMPREF0988_01269 [Lachnospiraceae bacterium 1_4_56FAA]CDB01471.1 putative uncharacterized protein [Lachnospiraceae bacterium CAG:215]